MKKFIKKIGKGIKKVGKAIGKPFKKLMKTKIGKIIGTIGMMMIGGWMMSGAKAFTTSLFNAQGLGTAFGEGISAMGQAAQASYNTITGGIKGMFGETTTTQKATSEKLKEEVVKNAGSSVDFASDAVVSGGQAPNIMGDQIASMPSPTGVQASAAGTGTETIDFTQSIADLESKGSGIPTKNLTETALEQGQGSTVKTNVLTGETTIEKVKPKSILDKTSEFVEGTATDDFASVEGYGTVRSGRNLTDRVVRKATGQETFVDTLADFWHGDIKGKTIKDKTLGIKPFQSFENVPGFIREGTVGEGIALNQALATPEEQYQQGYSDMSGALSALSENETRLYSSMPMNQMVNQTRLPSPSVIGTADYLNNTRKAGFIWDTSLLAVSPSNIAVS